MTLEERVKRLENQLDNLNKAFLQAQRNQVPITAKVDDSANQVKAITPYTETKTAYIGDTEIVFSDVPSGNISAFVKGLEFSYQLVKNGNNIIVTFPSPLEEVTEITISIS